MCLALLIALETFLWYFNEVPVKRLGNSFPCSLTKLIRNSGSL